MEIEVQEERDRIWIRFGSEESDIDTVLDGSITGWCRWCGTKMLNEYPKDGHALNYRCCSQVCQLLYGDHLGYWMATEEHSLPNISELAGHVRDYNHQVGAGLRSKTQTYPLWWLEQKRVAKAAKEKREARAAKKSEAQARNQEREERRTLKQRAITLGLPWRPNLFRSEKLFLAEMAKRVLRLEAENTPKAA